MRLWLLKAEPLLPLGARVRKLERSVSDTAVVFHQS